MLWDFSKLEARERYHLLVSTIVPRPIAWILSENADGSLNLAPFSYFALVSSSPPTVAVSIGQRRDGTPKDTRANLLAGRPAVLHLGAESFAESINASAASLPPGTSEVEASSLELEPFAPGPLPRLKGVPVAFHAHYSQHVSLRGGAQDLILLELSHLHVEEALLDKTAHHSAISIDSRRLEPLTRLGGDTYATLGQTFELPRPG